MTIQPGQDLLHYRIEEKLGEGGMGEVWKATDTTLDRTVAIKVLPAVFSNDAERLARFEREAKTLAALNHPHIAGLYGLHEAQGLRFLSMEFVEGEDLASRLTRGAMPVEEAVAVAGAIASALGTAHASGIVHRDLKPANVMLTADEEPKVLDFGLAKAVAPEAVSGQSIGASLSPTVTSMGTVAGMILGTAAYMSPEQARGKPLDRRSDLWSFGVMLYEMLSGTRLFGDGETVSDTLASVLKNEPDWSALPTSTPSAVRRLLQRCLQRDPKQRQHDADDARLDLENAFVEEQAEYPAARGGSALRAVLIGATALVVGLAIGFVLRGGGQPAAAPTSQVVSSLPAPPGVSIFVNRLSLAVSPDGEQLAFVGVDGEGRHAIYVRRLDTGDTSRLAGTESGRAPFWSPDGRELGFFTGTRMLRLPANGGTPQPITETNGEHGSWSPTGDILFSAGSTLWRVDAGGGVAERQGRPDFEHSLSSAPQFLPDGRHFIVDVLTLVADSSGIYLGQLGSPDLELVVAARSNGVYAGGRLMYTKDGHLVAQSFDTSTFELSGEPVRVAGPLLRLNYPFHGLFSASVDGRRLVYIPGDEATGLSEIVWVDRAGNELERTGIRGDLYNPRLYDGRLLGLDVSTRETHGDIWIFDLARGSSRQLTSDPIDESRPTWTADDSKILFFRIPDLYEITPEGGGEARQMYANDKTKAVSDASLDGRHVVFGQFDKGQRDLMVLDLDSGEARPWLATEANEHHARFSPDGRWLAYTSNESGRSEIYIDRFPGRGERFRVSSNGGENPIWRADGKELFFASPSSHVMAVPVDMDSDRAPIGEPQALFAARSRRGIFDVSADGERFLLNETIVVEATSMVLLQNWQAP